MKIISIPIPLLIIWIEVNIFHGDTILPEIFTIVSFGFGLLNILMRAQWHIQLNTQ